MPTWTKVRRAVEEFNDWIDSWIVAQALLNGAAATEEALKGIEPHLAVIESARVETFNQYEHVHSALADCLEGGLASDLVSRIQRAYGIFRENNLSYEPTQPMSELRVEHEEPQFYGG
jgi:hypothetical protein